MRNLSGQARFSRHTTLRDCINADTTETGIAFVSDSTAITRSSGVAAPVVPIMSLAPVVSCEQIHHRALRRGGNRKREIAMSSPSFRLLLATTILASPSWVFAADGVASSAQNPSHYKSPDTHGSDQGSVPTQFANDEATTAPRQFAPLGSSFVDDGWNEQPVCGPGDATCCDGCPQLGCCTSAANAQRDRRITADVELMAMRTHFSDDVLGKLGEHYELSERVVLGAENAHGIGGRIRFWTYDRTTPNLQGGSSLGADYTVTDFEGTTHFGTQWFDFILAGGIRFADIRLDIDSGSTRSNQMPGATFAIDMRSTICRDETHGFEWHSVGGARWSVLGCDWRSKGTALIDETRDDNVVATEVYGGFECSQCCRGHNLYARLVFEAQNWRSDALGENTGIDSMGFVGPGLNLGVNY
jgi:hypothetical protein